MATVLGIDLGTTNSCVAFTEGRLTTIIPNKAGYLTTPSVVAVLEDGKIVVGQVAKRQAIANPANTITSSKRFIGRRIDAPEVSHSKAVYAYEIFEGPHGDIRIRARSRELSLPEVASYILLETKRVAEEYLSQKVQDVVITVPAHFSDAQRQATKDAGRIAGLNVLRIINEPTAAAIAYGFNKKNNKKLAVFDLGGGTFDISILDIQEGVFKVLGTDGDTFLGGDDFDSCLIDFVADQFLETSSIDLRENKIALQRLKDACERTKCDLSSFHEVEINLPFIATKDGSPLHLNMTIDRETLVNLTGDIVDKCLEICKRCMENIGISKDDLDDVLLVGGQTRMPFLADRVSNFFGRSASKQINPDEAVAIGAAIHGKSLVSDMDFEMLLLDVTPLPLGIQSVGKTFTKLIEANTTVPVSRTKIFTTVKDNQQSVRIKVYQGYSPAIADNELLGEFVLEGIRNAPAGEPEIEVSFHIDANGIVQVSAKDLETNQQQSIKVTMSSGLSEDEIEEMAGHAQELEVKLRNEEESEAWLQKNELVLYKLRKVFLQNKAKLADDVAQRVQNLLQNSEDLFATKDVEKLKKIYDQIQNQLKEIEG
ncbi:MAG: molecular chaperone DnaK [Bdellovibrionales bacterium]|nr:molecular chaperone DnaK [Bdellovibrionales bacterium]